MTFTSLSSPELHVLKYTGNNGCYAAVIPSKSSKLKIINIIKQLGFPLELDKLHVTVMYSKDKPLSQFEPNKEPYEAKESYSGICNKISSWKGHNEKTYVVANIYSEDLQKVHDDLKALGAEHSYPEYSPHITLNSREEELTEEEQKAIEELNSLILKNPMKMSFEGFFISDFKD